MNHRFSIGNRVRVTGILAEFYPGKTGIVIAVDRLQGGVNFHLRGLPVWQDGL